nr:putative P6 protein [Cherry luteovirus A]
MGPGKQVLFDKFGVYTESLSGGKLGSCQLRRTTLIST